MVVTALVEEGQKTVTQPFFNPLSATASATRSVISWMSAWPRVLSWMERVFTGMERLYLLRQTIYPYSGQIVRQIISL
jgi:hypothetical protein